jgi:hypothetical protein
VYVRLESDLEKAMCTYADKLHILHIKLNLRGKRGFPDRLYFIPGGKPLMVEYKREGEPPRRLQTYIHAQLVSLGYRVEVVDNTAEGFALLESTLIK